MMMEPTSRARIEAQSRAIIHFRSFSAAGKFKLFEEAGIFSVLHGVERENDVEDFLFTRLDVLTGGRR